MNLKEALQEDRRFVVKSRRPGYAHETFTGTYSGSPPTEDELRDAMGGNSYFGSRGFSIDEKKKTFTITIHTD